MKRIKRIVVVMLSLLVVLSGCGSSSPDNELVVYFVPSRNPDDIERATEPLQNMLEEELVNQGFNSDEVTIEVGTNYETVGESLASGTAHVGFIPGGTYVLYSDDVDVALTATRFGLNHDSENAMDWNMSPTEIVDDQVTYYRALIIAGPSEKGQALAAKINSGDMLTQSDLESAIWGIQASTSSSAGYIYPSLWLENNYGISLLDLPQKVALDGYSTAVSQLANEQIDIMVAYADARLDFSDQWQTSLGRPASIFDETDVIGVTDGIYNDTISVTKDEVMTPQLKEAIQQAFINIGNTIEGKEIISIYSHQGYQIGNDSDYDGEREAQELIQSMQ